MSAAAGHRAVLLLAHGTPESLDQMPDYLARVRGGRPPSPELVEEMRHNYAAIGGRSPLTDITRAQAAALSAELGGTPVYVGMRNWSPFVAEALAEAAAAGVQELVALPMAPQYSTLSVAKYGEAVERSRPAGLEVRFVTSWHDHPGLLEAFAEKVREARAKGDWDHVVFTAHSLPLRVVEGGDPYPRQVEATARGVAERAGVSDYALCYQSAGRTPEPWLGPPLEEGVREAAERGGRRVLVVPVGFVCDHTEVLFDIDVQAAAAARARGLVLGRTASLNTSPAFIRALADLVCTPA
ncbi:MAG TPA: ferrochelatase [Vicinamibacteria bacterium]|nr:ferrochelatase [Vicinamibacteria bacterium]